MSYKIVEVSDSIPNAKSVAEMLGKNPVVVSSTGRPYLKIAEVGDANLYVNIEYGSAVIANGNTEGYLAFRFMQFLGKKDTFSPLTSREDLHEGKLFRLDKKAFRLGTFTDRAEMITKWHEAEGSKKVVKYLKDLLKKTPAEVVDSGLLAMVVDVFTPAHTQTTGVVVDFSTSIDGTPGTPIKTKLMLVSSNVVTSMGGTSKATPAANDYDGDLDEDEDEDI